MTSTSDARTDSVTAHDLQRELAALRRSKRKDPKRVSVRLSCTTSLQVAEAVEYLLWTGLYGRTRSEAVERLLCEVLGRKLDAGIIKVSDIRELLPPDNL